MSLNSIRRSYSKLLETLANAGVKLSESQKTDLDAFVLAIESNISKQRKLVERRMEKEYRKVFESIMANQMANAELASKIQDKITQINESKKMAQHVDSYLDLYVESVLPKKTIVDYDRMAKLERIQESLRDTLLVGEDAVQEKIEKLEESYRIKESKCETQVAKARAELNESMKKTRKIKEKLDSLRSKELLESKTKDLPTYEACKVKKQLKKASAPEIEKKFSKTLESVRRDMAKDETEKGPDVSNEIEKILETNGDVDADVDENDVLRDRPHNAHVPMSECDDEPFETMETVRETTDGDVELDESDIIDSDLMKMWCNQSVEVY